MGCGTGYTAVWLTERGIPTYGQDVYGGFKAFEKQRRGMGFLRGDITRVEPIAEFDFALLLDVIEHTRDDRAFVDHVGKLLKPNGLLIITVPAFSWLWSKVDDRSGHFRRYVRRDLLAFQHLPTTRFRIEFCSYFYLSTSPLYVVTRMTARFRPDPPRGSLRVELRPGPWVNSVCKMLLRLEAAVCLSVGLPLGSSLVVVLRKQARSDGLS